MSKFGKITKCRKCSCNLEIKDDSDHCKIVYCDNCKPKQIDIILYQKLETGSGIYESIPINLTYNQRKEIIKILNN